TSRPGSTPSLSGRRPPTDGSTFLLLYHILSRFSTIFIDYEIRRKSCPGFALTGRTAWPEHCPASPASLRRCPPTCRSFPLPSAPPPVPRSRGPCFPGSPLRQRSAQCSEG